MAPVLTITTWFPLVLAFALVVAGIDRKNEKAKAVIYYVFIYFSTEIPFRLLQPDYEERLYWLALASFALIILYHTLHITRFILIATVCELLLCGLNAFDVKITPMEHWRTTVILNLIGFAFIAGNYWHGDGGINKRLYYWRRPKAMVSGWVMAFCQKIKGVVAW